MGILREMPAEPGSFLWQTLRTVTLWAAAAQDGEKIFARGAERLRTAALKQADVGDLREPLRELTRLLGNPAATDAEVVARSCEAVANWASTNGMRATWLEFTRAAALATPDHAARALAVGRLTRDAGAYAIAETWLQRAIVLGRRSGDWDSYARAYLALGKMWIRRGRYPHARRSLEKAVRAAARHGAREAQAMAFHDLFTLEVYSKRYEEAVRCAAEAAWLYGPENEAFPQLAFDVAYHWMETGNAAPALPVFEALRSRFEGRQRLVFEGSLARVLGMLGQRERFRDAAAAVFAAPDDLPNKAGVLLEVALGSAALGDVATGERALNAAEALAERYRESWLPFKAEQIREMLAEAERKEREEQSLLSPHSPHAENLSRDLVSLLEPVGAR